MKPLFLLLPLLAILAVACDDDETPAPTATTQQLSPSATTAVEMPPVTPSPEPQDEGLWDESAVWQDYYETPVFTECLPSDDVKACVLGVAEDAGVSPAVSDFITENETALISFEEIGTVDYGEVSWIEYNMGRPEPVFLNGDFGVLYYGSLVPEDWHEADSSYAAIELDESGLGPFPWAEYSLPASSESDASGQRFIMETLIQECRACAPVAFLALEIDFDADGALSGVTVLPMRCEPESEDFQELTIPEGPCASP